MIPNLSYVLKLYKNPVDAKSTLIRSTSIASLEMFFSFPIIRPPSGISPSVYNLLWFLPKDPANTLKATVSVCSSILLANSVWSLDESKLCQLTKPQFEYDEIVPPILKSGSLLTKAYELFLILPTRSWPTISLIVQHWIGSAPLFRTLRVNHIELLKCFYCLKDICPGS